MSNSNKGTVPETAAEKAVSDLAMNRFRDYKQRWAPMQLRLAETIKSMGKEGSFERERLKSAQAADATVAFDKAGDQVAQRDTAAGINRNSSAAKLRQQGLRTDRAASVGIGGAISDQMIDDAYIGGLDALMRMGRGQEAGAVRGMGQSAQIAAGIAQNDAALAADQRAGNFEAAGTAIGIGAGSMMRGRRGNSPMGQPNAGPQLDYGVNNPNIGIPVN